MASNSGSAIPTLKSCLGCDDPIYFDLQITARRPAALERALDAGKHLYCEKPLATDLETAMAVAQTAEGPDVKHGIVQHTLWLPGSLKLDRLLESGFVGELLSVRVEFGYWVCSGHGQPG